MSLNEIIEELPRLSLHERRSLVRKLIDLEPGREDLEKCDRLADEAMQMLDQMEVDCAEIENEKRGERESASVPILGASGKHLPAPNRTWMKSVTIY